MTIWCNKQGYKNRFWIRRSCRDRVGEHRINKVFLVRSGKRMGLPRDKTGSRIKNHTLSLKGSNQGIGLGLSLHYLEKAAVQGIGENSRKRAACQHGQQQ